jgi:hypothetical protein
LGIEPIYDSLTIYDAGTNRLLDKISGTSDRPLSFQVATGDVKIEFRSDDANNTRGFKLIWRALASVTAPAATSCSAPEIITSLPFTKSTTTCNDNLTGVENSPCDDDAYFAGKDHLFRYTSKGNECVQVTVTDFIRSSRIGIFGEPVGLNIGVFKGCPNNSSSQCMAQGILNFTKDTTYIINVKLEEAGDYYFAVARNEACTPFNITINKVNCLIQLPNAGFCDKAISLNDCGNKGVYDISVDLTGGGDSTFIKVDPATPNVGCIESISNNIPATYNFAMFYFKAFENGKFGFTIESLSKDLATDFDFTLYGPIDNIQSLCSFSKSNIPLRCSGGQEYRFTNRTGMVDSYMLNGKTVEVKDDSENSFGDGLVRTLAVQKDKYYLIWINDYVGSIGNTGVRMRFDGTTAGVLDSAGNTQAVFTINKDTTICAGGTAQLSATGGTKYKWTPTTGLNNAAIANPQANPSASTNYKVEIQGTCQTVNKNVNVGVVKLNPLSNLTVCKGDERTFNAGDVLPSTSSITWNWTSSTGHLSELSCINCPNPVFKATNTTNSDETHIFTVNVNSSNCPSSQTFSVIVKPQQGANYQVVSYPKVTRDLNVCMGSTTNLLKTGFDASATYNWSSSPATTLTGNNPSVSPTVNTKYFVTVTGGAGGCTTPKTDSVILNVFNPIVLKSISDTTLCEGAKITLGNNIAEENTTYEWTPATGLSSATVPNPTLNVQPGTITYTLKATTAGNCIVSTTVRVTGIVLNLSLNVNDSIRICKGTTSTLSLSTNAPDTTIRWSSNRDFTVFDSTAKRTIRVTPNTLTQYVVQASLPGCTKRDTVRIFLDSVPFNMRILPQDTTVCQGAEVTFRSPTFEPVFFPGLTFKWNPSEGALTPDSFYNLVVTATRTLTFKRTANIGVCEKVDSVKLNVNPIPQLTVLPRDTTVCGPKSITLRATSNPANATDWKWKENGQEAKQYDGKTTITVSPSQSTSYQVEAKIGDCPSSAQAQINVEANPVFQFPNPPAVCPSGSTVLNRSPRSDYTYQWAGPNGFTSTASAPTVSPTVVTRYTVTIITRGGCRVDTAVTITPATATLTVTPDTTVCQGSVISLVANGTTNVGPGTYLWNTGMTTDRITPQTTSAATYTVIYNYGPGCIISRSTRVNLVPPFNVRISPDTFSQVRLLDEGTPVTLTAVLSGAASATYSWTLNGTPAGNGQSINITPTGEAPNPRAGVVLSAVANGCRKDTTLTIFLRKPAYKIPNAFTPNGDEINNTFTVLFYENPNNIVPPLSQTPRLWKGNINVQSFEIYNRLGQRIFTENNNATLNSVNYRGWDGKKGGNDAPSDVYIYVIKLRMPDGTIKAETGELNLIR